MKIATVIENIRTHLLSQTWTSDSGAGTTQFQAGYSYDNHENTTGYPFFVVNDNGSAGSGNLSTGIDYVTTIRISFYLNWSTVTGADGDLKREETMIRLREIQDFMIGYTALDQRTTDWGFGTSVFHDNFNINEANIRELDLVGRYIEFDLQLIPKSC